MTSMPHEVGWHFIGEDVKMSDKEPKKLDDWCDPWMEPTDILIVMECENSARKHAEFYDMFGDNPSS